nr:hypothetical protein [Tanacetum cinerariifolium]
VDAYECAKIILDIYGDTVTLKRRRDDKDKDKEPSAGSDRGSKRRRAAQAENEDFLNKLDENIHKIINEQVKEQVKVQVSKILPNIEKTVNEQLEAEVLTRASNSSKTSYAVAVDLSELELKKILIEKIESNKSIHRSDDQRNLYKLWLMLMNVPRSFWTYMEIQLR